MSQAQEDRLSSLLARFHHMSPEEAASEIEDAPAAEAFVERLPLKDETVVPLLQIIHDTYQHKPVKKAVKRALFRLQSKGISVAGFREESDSKSVLRPIKREEPRCYLGPIDLLGNRAVIIHSFESGKGVDAGMGMASDQEGIGQFVFDQMSRKTARELMTELEEMAGPFVEVPLSHGAMVLENAFKIENPNAADARADYLKLRPWLLRNTSARDHSVDFNGVTVPDREITEPELEKLFDNDLMASWLAPFDVLKPFMMEMQSVDESPIILSDSQKLNRMAEIKENCLNKLFDAAGRRRFKNRLREMAFFFLKSGAPDDARLALLAAADIQEETSPFSEQLVLPFFVDRSIAFYFELGNENDAEAREFEDADVSETPSGIILP